GKEVAGLALREHDAGEEGGEDNRIAEHPDTPFKKLQLAAVKLPGGGHGEDGQMQCQRHHEDLAEIEGQEPVNALARILSYECGEDERHDPEKQELRAEPWTEKRCVQHVAVIGDQSLTDRIEGKGDGGEEPDFSGVSFRALGSIEGG